MIELGERGPGQSKTGRRRVKVENPLDHTLRARDPARPARTRVPEVVMLRCPIGLRTSAVVLGCVLSLQLLAIAAFAAPAGAPPPSAKSPQPAQPVPSTPWGQLKSDKGQTWPLTKLEITIGSDATSDVVLPDATVAPHHCRITFANGNAAIEDLGSKSGTLVAGSLIKPGKPFPITNAVTIDPGAVALKFEFLERGTVGPSASVKRRKPEPKVKIIQPKNK